jgi:hypothetical protein
MYSAGFIGYDPVCIAAVKAFEDSFNKTLRPVSSVTFEIDTQDKAALLGEYADWLDFDINMSPEQPESAGHDLGIAAAVLYNTLVKNAAMRKNHRGVASVCMKVNAIVYCGMELDQGGKGWISFRLLFASRP